MIEILVTIAGLSFGNAEVVQSLPAPREIWTGTPIFDELIVSDCYDWQGSACFDSRIVLHLGLNRLYEFYVLEEAKNRDEPNRDSLDFIWRFHPADLNMDGILSSEDLMFYLSNEYDYNMDGFINNLDIIDLMNSFFIPQGPKFRQIDGPILCC